MVTPDSDDRRPGPGPRVGRHAVNGTTLYAEVRGSGPAILLIPGGAEDADGWRPVAERLPGRTVVTYDRRGTLRSGREEWPGRGSAQHADDAAALLKHLGLGDVLAFGGSSGGIIAIQLGLRHPGLVRRVLAFEPGYLMCVPDGARMQRLAVAAVEAHLALRPSDWAGAYRALDAAVSPALAGGRERFLVPPSGGAWHAEREVGNAEAFVRDDVSILTAEAPDEASIRTLGAKVRFAHGSDTPRLFRDIVVHLASLRREAPDVVEGVGHSIYVNPDAAAAYVLAHSL